MIDIHSENTKPLESSISTGLSLKQHDTGYARLMVVAPPASQSEHNPINILRLPDVMKRVGLKHASIYQRMSQGSFPKQISLGDRAVGWLEHEIEAWLQARVSLSRTKVF